MRRLAGAVMIWIMIWICAAMAEPAALSIEAPGEEIRPGRPVIVSFTVPEDGVCSIELRDETGASVLNVAEERAAQAGYNSMYWNGTCGGIPVPEGNYHVRLTNRGYAAEEDVVIERDKESEIDLSKVDIKEVAIGHVTFTIVPDYAQLFVDGQMTDFEEGVTLEYGVHRIHVELAGYKSVDTNIRISDKFI